MCTHGGIEIHTECWCENVKERDQFEDLGVNGRIILNSIVKKYNERRRSEFIWFRIWRVKVVGSCEDGNEPSDCIKCE